MRKINYNFIKNWSDFIINETLKTHPIDFAVNDIFDELSLTGIKCELNKIENKLELKLFNFFSYDNIELIILYINSLFLDRNGWFPSKFTITKRNGLKNTLKYDEDFLINNKNNIEEVKITFEPKYDEEEKIPKKLFHLSIQEHENSVLKNGLCPKSKSKKTITLDRIYVCSDPYGCKKLIPEMMVNYEFIKSKNELNELNDKWIIYEINTTNLDIKLYKDPNYKGGYYTTDNINPKNIKIYEKEY